MKQIAQETGVSVSTVSLVLNGRDEGRVKPGIASQVRDTARKLGYTPNPLARSLRTSKTKILGFLSEEIATTPFAGRIILGAHDAASALGHMMLTVNTDRESDESEEISALKRYGVDGFLYAKMFNRVITIPKSFGGYPVVLVDATDSKGAVPGITPDEFRIGYDAARRLIDAGCSQIAYVGSDSPIVAQKGRSKGYRKALADAGIPYNPGLDIGVGNNRPALDAVSSLFDRAHPDGFFCFNDARAWYVYECAARRGLAVGRDISVVGVDNHRVFAETFAPDLTTVELPHYEMGYWAAYKLISLIEGRDPEPDLPETTAGIPSLDSPLPVRIHCMLIEKNSVA